MEIEFDAAKASANLAKHGIDLANAQTLFQLGTPTIELDDRFDYGEERFIATGLIGSRVFVCAFTMRDALHRIISLRLATKGETDAYYQSHGG